MSVPTDHSPGRPIAAPLTPHLTAADLAALPCDLPSGTVDYELDNGRVITMVPPGDVHGSVQSNLAAQLKIQGEWRGHGKARTEVGIVLWRNPDRVVGADVAFIATNRLPLQRSEEGYLETIPNLIVEIRSRNDTAAYIQRKVADYLTAGVEIVWLADPQQQTVSVQRAGQAVETFSQGETLRLDCIPDFQISVEDVFRD